ncbi:MAG: hypothetical protein NWS22_03335, partial [Porticoccaceae bacterium]|nr:hypothetical protein [Porticoccaceae bacterium]
GWILRRKEEGEPLELIIENETGETRVPLDVERPDVISRVLNKVSDKRLRCGFKLTIKDFSNTSLYIASNGRRHLWIKIHFDKEPEETLREKFNTAMKLLKSSHQSTLAHQLHHSEVKIETSLEELRDVIDTKLKVTNFHNFKNMLDPSSMKQASHFFDYIKDVRVLSDWLNSAQTLNHIITPDIFSTSIARSSLSFFSNSKINLIFFDSPSEPFIVLQHVTFADAIFFPDRCLAVLIQNHLTQDSIARSLAEAAAWMLERLKKSSVDSNRFGGVIFGFGRPYHYFYDILPALMLIEDSRTIGDYPHLFYSSGTVFADPSEIFEKIKSIEKADPATIRDKATENNEFYFHIGLPFNRLSKEFNDRLDQLIYAAALRKHPQPDETHNRQPLRIWWGITGQKRSWIEQVEGTAYILDQLAQAHPGLEVVFDGWTTPIDPGPSDAEEIQRDQTVVAEILSQMQKSIVSRSIIGKSSLEKIAIATTCDVFVANYSTGSMYVSRFARRPGVLHINNQLPKEDHIQHRTVVVPASRTKDLPEDEDKRADFVSYSIDPDDILFLLRSVIEARNSN